MWQYIFLLWYQRRGSASTEWGLGTVVLVLALIMGYVMFPGEVHRFIQYILNTVYDALHQATGNKTVTPNNGSGGTGRGIITVPEYNLPNIK